MLCPVKNNVYLYAASVCWLVFYLHIAKMKNSWQNLVNFHLITFPNSYNQDNKWGFLMSLSPKPRLYRWMTNEPLTPIGRGSHISSSLQRNIFSPKGNCSFSKKMARLVGSHESLKVLKMKIMWIKCCVLPTLGLCVKQNSITQSSNDLLYMHM